MSHLLLRIIRLALILIDIQNFILTPTNIKSHILVLVTFLEIKNVDQIFCKTKNANGKFYKV